MWNRAFNRKTDQTPRVVTGREFLATMTAILWTGCVLSGLLWLAAEPVPPQGTGADERPPYHWEYPTDPESPEEPRVIPEGTVVTPPAWNPLDGLNHA